MVKNHYLIQRILGKIVGHKTSAKDPLNILDISAEGQKKARNYNEKSASKSNTKLKNNDMNESKNEFIQYQKEIQAIKLLKKTVNPPPPGKILKLPDVASNGLTGEN